MRGQALEQPVRHSLVIVERASSPHQPSSEDVASATPRSHTPPIEDRLPDWDTIFTPLVLRNAARVVWLSLSVWFLVRGIADLFTVAATGPDPYAGEAAIVRILPVLVLGFPLSLAAAILIAYLGALVPDAAGPALSPTLGLPDGVVDWTILWAILTLAGYVQWFVLVPRLARWIHGVYRRQREAADRQRGWS